MYCVNQTTYNIEENIKAGTIENLNILTCTFPST